MDELIQIATTIEKIREMTASSEAAFRSLGDELIISLISSCAIYIKGITEEDIAKCAKEYCIIYKYADNTKKREVFFDQLKHLVEICAIEDEVKQKQSFNENKETIIYSLKKEERELILPYLQSDLNAEGVIDTYIDTDELLLQHNNSITNIDFSRLDFAIKYMFIEYHYGLNDDGYDLYKKLQAGRIKNKKSAIDGEDSAELSCKFFTDLIKSFDENGYDESSYITCNNNLTLLDGSHRLVLCLYYKIPSVHVRILKDKEGQPFFTEDDLRSYGFTDEELDRVNKKTEELVLEHLHPISCIMWPPVAHLFDVIEKDIRTNCCNVVSSTDYEFSDETLPRVIRGVYAIDDIADWKVNTKIDAIQKCNCNKVRVLDLAIFAPRFRLKAANNHTLSIPGENLKKYLRGKYSKYVPNYIYDIVVHTADNFSQSDYMYCLFMPCINLVDYFEAIREFKYCIIKHDTPYMTKDFPKTYPFSKDIDIICDKNEYKSFVDKTLQFLEKREHPCTVRTIEKGGHTLIRMELNGFLLLQLDVGYSIEGVKPDFLEKVIANREYKDGYYVPTIPDECFIRVNEYVHNTNKKHHLEYVNTHMADFDLKDCCKYIECDENFICEIFER